MSIRRLATWIAGGATAILIAGPVGAVMVALVAAGIRPLVRRRRVSAERRTRCLAFPDALDVLMTSIESGATPRRALETTERFGPEPTRPAFAEALRRADRGAALADAIQVVADEIGPPAVTAVDTIALSQRHGAPLRDSLDAIASDAARQRTQRAQASARRLPVLLSFPLVLCVLPAFVLVAIAPAVLAAISSISSTGW